MNKQTVFNVITSVLLLVVTVYTVLLGIKLERVTQEALKNSLDITQTNNQLLQFVEAQVNVDKNQNDVLENIVKSF